MWLEKLFAGILRVLTPLGARYIQPSFAQRIYLLWIFRHFKVLPLQVLTPRQRRVIDALCVEPRFVPLLDRIGQALKAEQGNVQVIGYTDNQPIHNVQFPSNFQLSVARAEAAKNILGNTVGNAARLAAEGRGESDPIASNTTLEGREQNRRIEIVLHRPNARP